MPAAATASTIDVITKKMRIRSKRNSNVRNHEKPLNYHHHEASLLVEEGNKKEADGGDDDDNDNDGEFNPEFSFQLDSLRMMDNMEGSGQSSRDRDLSFTDKYLKDVTVRNLRSTIGEKIEERICCR
jgi:hypothetical protein